MSPFSQGFEAGALGKRSVLKLDNKQIFRNLLHTQHHPLKATSKTPSEPEKLPPAAGSKASRNDAEKRGPSVARAHVDINVPVRGLGCQWAPCVQRASEAERSHTQPATVIHHSHPEQLHTAAH